MKSKKQKMTKITPDFVIDEYLKAKELKGLKKKDAMARVKFLSQNLNKMIPESV